MEKDNLLFIVDDDISFNRSVEIFLQSKGFKNIMRFNTGEQCINKINLKPDVVILDYNLKSGSNKRNSGVQVAEQIKCQKPGINIIMFSGEMHNNTNRFTDPRFYNNVDKYLIKGIDGMNNLVNAINEFI